MCAKFWFSAIIYAEVIANKSFPQVNPLVPGLKLSEVWNVFFFSFITPQGLKAVVKCTYGVSIKGHVF